MPSGSTKQPKQARSERTRAALLNALEALLLERSFEDIGVVEIAEKARLSPASIYRRFDKKDGLLRALYDLHVQRVQEWTARPDITARLEVLSNPETPLKDFLGGHVRLAVQQLRDLAHLARPMALYGRLRPHIFGEEAEAYMVSAHAGILAELEKRRSEIARRDLDRAAAFLAYFMQSALNDFVLFKDRTVLPTYALDDDAFADEITDFAYGYLKQCD